MRTPAMAAAMAVVLATTGCEPGTPTPVGNGVCDPPTLQARLPSALEETSGVAASRVHSGVFWSHNDSGGEPVLFAIDTTGAVTGLVRVLGATNRDWEDIALGPCGPGEDDCLWIAEIGDNNEHHPHIAVYRVPEPDPATDTVTARARIIRFTYPDGPRDAESLFVTDAGIHVINKGRTDAIELFRLPPPYDTEATRPMDRIQRLAPPPTSVSAQVTAAAVDAAGKRVVVRTYSGLRFFSFDSDTLRTRGRAADIVAPGQLKGEAVDFVSENQYVLTSESQGPRPALLSLFTCDPLRPPPDTTDTVEPAS